MANPPNWLIADPFDNFIQPWPPGSGSEWEDRDTENGISEIIDYEGENVLRLSCPSFGFADRRRTLPDALEGKPFSAEFRIKIDSTSVTYCKLWASNIMRVIELRIYTNKIVARDNEDIFHEYHKDFTDNFHKVRVVTSLDSTNYDIYVDGIEILSNISTIDAVSDIVAILGRAGPYDLPHLSWIDYFACDPSIIPPEPPKGERGSRIEVQKYGQNWKLEDLPPYTEVRIVEKLPLTVSKATITIPNPMKKYSYLFADNDKVAIYLSPTKSVPDFVGKIQPHGIDESDNDLTITCYNFVSELEEEPIYFDEGRYDGGGFNYVFGILCQNLDIELNPRSEVPSHIIIPSKQSSSGSRLSLLQELINKLPLDPLKPLPYYGRYVIENRDKVSLQIRKFKDISTDYAFPIENTEIISLDKSFRTDKVSGCAVEGTEFIHFEQDAIRRIGKVVTSVSKDEDRPYQSELDAKVIVRMKSRNSINVRLRFQNTSLQLGDLVELNQSNYFEGGKYIITERTISVTGDGKFVDLVLGTPEEKFLDFLET